MTRWTFRSLIATASVALVAGCGSDSPSSPSRTLDLSAVLSQMSLGRVSSVPGASAVISLPATAGVPTIVPSACTYSPTLQGFACPTTSSGGLTFDIAYFLYDAAGHTQSQADANTTASVRTVVDAKGTVTLPQSSGLTGTVVVADHNDMTMSGLLTTMHTLNGTGTSHYDLTLTGNPSLHSVIDMTTVTKDLTFANQSDGTSPAWPSSGTITTDSKNATALGTLGAVTTSSHAVITFNGTSTATIVFTTSATTTVTTCKIDLTGKTAPVCS
ncbi:MAG: hypothetical protein ACM3SX_20625 [Deltaproteobacteria bacterium]